MLNVFGSMCFTQFEAGFHGTGAGYIGMMLDQPGLGRTWPDDGPPLARGYARRVEGGDVARLEKYASSLNIEVNRAVRSHRSLQSASVAVVPRWRLTRF